MDGPEDESAPGRIFTGKSGDCRPQNGRSARNKNAIQQKGLLVTWRAHGELLSGTQNIIVDVTLWKPKENLPRDLAKIYDDWLMRQNGIKP